MIVLALVSIIGAIAYPRISDGLRKMRARDGAKALVDALLSARAQAMIRNQAHRITLASSTQIGAQAPTGGGSITVERASGSSCTAAGTSFTPVDQYLYAPLRDVNLCLIRTTSAPAVDENTACASDTVQLCVTPEGLIVNLANPNIAQTIAYVREYEMQGATAVPVGVVRQVVMPLRKAVQVNPIQVTNDACL
jgi:type II secretory pathway pseudopilin PulG